MFVRNRIWKISMKFKFDLMFFDTWYELVQGLRISSSVPIDFLWKRNEWLGSSQSQVTSLTVIDRADFWKNIAFDHVVVGERL